MYTYQGTMIVDNKIVVGGKELPPCPIKGGNITIINNKVYQNGYEFKNGMWKKTFKAWWYRWF